MANLFSGARALIRWTLFQLHWVVGITAGSLLMLIGLSGATLSFEEEWLAALNPGVLSVPQRSTPALTPPQLLAALGPLPAGQTIGTAIFSATPGHSVELLLKTAPGAAKALPLYVDPYSGQLLGTARGQAFFDWVERLHRFLLLPREPGRVAAGILSICLLWLIASGIYLRWPRQPLNWRVWLSFNPRLKGRPFLWALHAVVATWALPAWLLLASTGIYWSFDAVRSTVDGWADAKRAPRMKPEGRNKPEAKAEPAAAPDLSAAWQRFQGTVPAWRELRLRLPERAGGALEILWLAPDAAHERQRNSMQIALDGELKKDQRFAEQSAGKRALAAIYPLHMGRYFGLPVRILMMLSALALPLLGISGWLLYLRRRRQQRDAAAQRKALSPTAGAGDTEEQTILVAWASQSGRAESLALRTAAALQAAGRRVVVKSLAGLAPLELAGYPQALFVVSTFGEGQAPDQARGFAHALEQAELSLADLRFAVLALGNRQYAQFCAFGQRLQASLLQFGASPLQPLTPVCDSEPQALEPWFQGLGRFGVAADTLDRLALAEAAPVWQDWQLQQRELLNPGSSGEPLFELSLLPAGAAALPSWQPGALAQIQPQHSPLLVEAFLRAHGFDPQQRCQQGGTTRSLAECFATSVLPASCVAGDVAALLLQIEPLPPRAYSIASIREDGVLQLIVRQRHHAGGMGLASGFLTAHCPLGGTLALRLQPNPAFSVSLESRPCVFIGNGSGIAGLRGLLRERVRHGLGDNWLVFGERQRASDSLCASEFDSWIARGLLELDRVFSRDAEGAYVQDFLRQQAPRLRALLERGAVIHVCGSLQGMAAGVDALLAELLGQDGVAALAAQGRYRRDVY